MANLFQAIYDFFASIVELIVSTFSTIFHTLKGAVEGLLNLLFGVVNLFEDVLKGAIDVVGGVGKFIVGEFGSFRIPWSVLNVHDTNAPRKATLSSLRLLASRRTRSYDTRRSRESP